MLREPASSVLELLYPAGATLVFSPVVLGELKRQHVDEVGQLALEIQTRLRRKHRPALCTARVAETPAEDLHASARPRECFASLRNGLRPPLAPDTDEAAPRRRTQWTCTKALPGPTDL